MASVSVVTVLPPASSTFTAGWVMKALPPVAPAGSVVKTSWLGRSHRDANAALGALKASPASVAVRTSPVPAVLIVHPLNDSHPGRRRRRAARERARPAVSAMVMGLVSVVTVLPPASSMVTIGWVGEGGASGAPAGSVVKTSWLGTPVPTSNELLVVVKRVTRIGGT